MSLWFTPASALPPCAPHKAKLAELRALYNEAPVAAGLTQSGHLLELLAAPDGRTWTILRTDPRGIACTADAGESWQERGAAAGDDEGPGL